MKFEIGLKEKINCDHCYCIEDSVKTGDKMVERTQYGGLFVPINTPHLKCCNCGNKKIKSSQEKPQ